MAEEIPHSLNPLALSQSWGQDEHDDIHTAPLIALEEVLETSSLRRGISREQLLSELLRDLDHRPGRRSSGRSSVRSRRAVRAERDLGVSRRESSRRS